MHHALATLALGAALAAPAAAQNLLVNGDFERHPDKGCLLNLHNAELDAELPGCTSFGPLPEGGEIDVMQGGDCGFGLGAPSGRTKLGIAADDNGIDGDAFSIRLVMPLQPGRPYRLTFQASAYLSSFSPDIGAVEVGLSQVATHFGTQVGALLPSAVAWSTFDEIIVPTTAATFLTVRCQSTADAWNHIDNFRLQAVGPAGLALDADDASVHVTGASPDSLVALLLAPVGDAVPFDLAAALNAPPARGIATTAPGSTSPPAPSLPALTSDALAANGASASSALHAVTP